MANRRNGKRMIRRLPAVVCCGKDECKGTSSNLSSTGLFIRVIKPLPLDSLIKITVEIKDNKMVLTGKVVRSEKPPKGYLSKVYIPGYKEGMGVKLIEISEEYKEFLAELFKEREYIAE